MHEHEHEHHEHSHHGMQQNISPKKLLESMYTHNVGHLNELSSVAGMLNEEAKQKVLQAVEVLKQGNDLLGDALKQVKED